MMLQYSMFINIPILNVNLKEDKPTDEVSRKQILFLAREPCCLLQANVASYEQMCKPNQRMELKPHHRAPTI